MLTLPAGYTFFGASNNGNTVTFIKTGHTVQKPLTLVMKRTIPTFQNGVWSKPSFDVKVVRGLQDSDGKPLPTKLQIGTDGIRWDVNGAGLAAEMAAAAADFAAVVGHADFDEAVLAQAFANSAA